ncbi:triose-phosphate isomerase [Peptostreptococcaceae bacterium oral taxon 113 str. W5053]|nr:triose-phosphate isomerase [Peptostreptococcaceae bacterium oral taxon 113 str. W5053]
MRKKIIAGNWKMNTTATEGKVFIEKLLQKKLSEKVDIVVCVPFTHLCSVGKMLKGSSMKLGAQNMYFDENGAYTGEISPLMLLDLGVEYVILGHSERRSLFQEDDELINRKLQSALAHGLKPILCVGENLEERETGKVQKVLSYQLRKGFDNLSRQEASQVVIAYEPIWAIGTGKTASDEEAEETIFFIRKTMGEMYDSEFSENIRIQYGGSVKPSNIKGLMNMKNIDGALVGGASLNVEDFEQLVNYEL